ncbi:hypothetical protein [Cohnella massiliensis]|uniref:hypothetical protein n=1 Tax=Cohnella massiliensis TaxID=1816691 RepID=UPI0009BBD526|nr:hypothetical protein [Cohnella massiliensis]
MHFFNKGIMETTAEGGGSDGYPGTAAANRVEFADNAEAAAYSIQLSCMVNVGCKARNDANFQSCVHTNFDFFELTNLLRLR